MGNVIYSMYEKLRYQKLEKDRDFDQFWLKVRRRKKKKETFRVLLRKLKTFLDEDLLYDVDYIYEVVKVV